MTGLGMFEAQHIDEQGEDPSEAPSKMERDQEEIKGVVRLKDNRTPKGMVALERIFYLEIPPDKYREIGKKN